MAKNTILTLSWIVMVMTLLVLTVSLNKFGVLTGFSTSNDTATANLTITTQASLRFTTSTCDFESGAVDEEALYAVVYNNGTTINGSWDGSTNCGAGLVLQNDGDVNLSVAVSSDTSAADFIGGDRATPSVKIMSSDEGGAGGLGCNGTLQTSYTELTGSVNVCNNLVWYPATDEGGSISIDFELTIPEDAPGGSSGMVITATGTG